MENSNPINGQVNPDGTITATVTTVHEEINIDRTVVEENIEISSDQDYFTCKEGEMDPVLGKKIKDIIMSSHTYIVYIDAQEDIQWATKGHSTYGKKFGVIANKISIWESLCNKLFEKQDAYTFKCLLAEGYARMLDEGDDATANEIVDNTCASIKKLGEEVLRQSYIIASFRTSVLVCFAIIITVMAKQTLLTSMQLNPAAYTILLTGLFGGVGAFVSTITRSKNYNADINIGKNIHQIDGAMRIIFGMFAGIVVSLAIKSNMVFGFINSSTTNVFVEPFLGAIAGASEVILPSIIKQVEDKSAGKGAGS